MSLEHDPLGDGVRMFRAATAAPADGAATRARVLEEAERRIVRRARFHRAAVGAATLLAVLSFGSVAWTALGHWRASRAAARAVPAAQPAPARAGAPPALAPAPPPEPP
jgi:hypothetical protein